MANKFKKILVNFQRICLDLVVLAPVALAGYLFSHSYSRMMCQQPKANESIAHVIDQPVLNLPVSNYVLTPSNVSLNQVQVQSKENFKLLVGLGSSINIQDSFCLDEKVIISEDNLQKLNQAITKTLTLDSSLANVHTLRRFFNAIHDDMLGKIFHYLHGPLQTCTIVKLQYTLPENYTSTKNLSGLTGITYNSTTHEQNTVDFTKDQFLIMCRTSGLNESQSTDFLKQVQQYFDIYKLLHNYQKNQINISQVKTTLSTIQNSLANSGILDENVNVTISSYNVPSFSRKLTKNISALNVQIYTPVPLTKLNAAFSYDYQHHINIGIGKAFFIPINSSNCGILGGIDSGLNFIPTKNASFHYRYGHIYAKAFLGLGIAV